MRVHLFGILAEKAGSDVVELEGAATDELRAEFRRRFPNTKGLMFAMAVDRKVVNGNQPLNGNEEVAMLPVRRRMSEKKHKVRDIFIEGPIDPQFVADSLAKHATRMDIGAHELFLGQVRADGVAGADHRPSATTVEAIAFTAYRDMALERMTDIREEAFALWPSMICLHVHHSLGRIPAGQLCFFVFASSPHRKAAREAVAWVVDRIKADLPIFGKEIFADETHTWKTNRSVDPSGRPDHQ